MWHNRKKLFLTRNPNYVITSIRYFPNINTSVELYKKDNDIVRLQEDKKYRNIVAYYELFYGGHDIIPLYFADDNVKIAKLDKLYPQGRSYFWCLAYVSDYLADKNKAIFRSCRSLNTPSLETLLDWLKYYSKNYCNDTSSLINRRLAQDYLKKWIVDNSKDKISHNRRFELIYNCSTIFEMNRELTVKDWITHLENLSNRDFYEIIVNDFE